MIGRLKGILLEKKPPHLLIDIAGVGYEVEASMQTIYQLPAEQEEITLYTHLIVREDAHLLYGFYDTQERALFRLLIKTNGVGPKLALAILSNSSTEQFIHHVNNQDDASLVKIPGVGKKTAQRLIVEMHDRLSSWQGDALRITPTSSSQCDNIVVRRTAVQDAISALVALGYKPQQASQAVSQIYVEGHSSETLIRDALKRMAS